MYITTASGGHGAVRELCHHLEMCKIL